MAGIVLWFDTQEVDEREDRRGHQEDSGDAECSSQSPKDDAKGCMSTYGSTPYVEAVPTQARGDEADYQ